MTSATQDPIDIVREALAEESQTEPAERFDRLVESQMITADGELLRDDGEPAPGNGSPAAER